MEPMELKTTMYPVSDGVWAIDQEMVRCFLIVGAERALLLDTGAGECDLMGMIRSVTDMPLLVVQSHGDGDHTGNSQLFSEIYAHPAEFPILTRFRPDWKPALLPVAEGYVFDLGGRRLEVIEAPGHTPGSICLLDRENRILFSGDTVSYGPVFLFGSHRDIAAYRSTLVRLKALDSFDTVYPCHNTCPVSPEVIGKLIAAVDGALDGSIQPDPFGDMPMPDGARPECYRVEDCGILYIKDET